MRQSKDGAYYLRHLCAKVKMAHKWLKEGTPMVDISDRFEPFQSIQIKPPQGGFFVLGPSTTNRVEPVEPAYQNTKYFFIFSLKLRFVFRAK
ncbi:MAG: hypothetical protein RJB66_311 [Pseudomonadota bacterium]|jgi:hypothetical protein